MKRFFIVLISLIAALAFMILFSLQAGSVAISFPTLVQMIGEMEQNTVAGQILWQLRIPRLLAGILFGGALGVSGYLLQTFFGNPIAGPYILGISSGAKLTVALFLIFFLRQGKYLTSFEMVVAAFLGAMIAMLFVLLMSLKVKKMGYLIVCGIMIGYICSGITDFVIAFASDENIVNLHNWSMGSLSGITWENISVASKFILLAVVGTLFLSKPIGAYLLGEDYAKSMGVSTKGLRIGLILLSSVLSATVTAFAGPISFVGIAVPHVIKNCFKSTKPLVMIPGCFLGGAVITLFCDGLARSLLAPTEVSISSVTAIMLSPIVMMMMIRKRRNE